MIVISDGKKNPREGELKEWSSVRRTANGRKGYAGHPDAEPSVLDTLARDSHHPVRYAVASNPSTRPDTLEWLYTSKGKSNDKYMKCSLASNPSVPIEMLEALFLIVSEHIDENKWDTTREEIEKEVALNPSTPESMLLRIVENPTHPKQLQYVMKNEGEGLTDSVILKVLEDDGWGKSVVSKHPRLPLGLIERFSKDESVGVRMNIASHPSTPPEILRELANDDYLNIMGTYCVRQMVEKNPNTPEDVVRGLSLWTEKSCKKNGYKNDYESKIWWAEKKKREDKEREERMKS